jgi:hypothetical protein
MQKLRMRLGRMVISRGRLEAGRRRGRRQRRLSMLIGGEILIKSCMPTVTERRDLYPGDSGLIDLRPYEARSGFSL